MNSFIDKVLKRPYAVLSFLGIFLFLGVYGYNSIDRKLFPDSNRPQISVVIVEPGASAKEMAANIAVPVEKELYTIDKVRRVFSTTIDEVSIISAEFEYSKSIQEAATDVANAISKIRTLLPSDIKEPQIHKITAATAPVLVIAMSSQTSDLMSLRELARNEIKNQLLKIPGVSNVDIFGGYEEAIIVTPDLAKLQRYNLTSSDLLKLLQANDKDFALGFIEPDGKRFLVRIKNKKNRLEAIKRFPLTPSIKLEDVADVRYSHYENSALYFGNGKPAIALAVQRSIDADVIKTIEAVEKELETLQKSYPNITFEISDTQKDTIVQSITNMFESLRDAIIMSTIVAFFFLASLRQVLVVLVTIPLVYATTVAFMYLFGIEFNVVTLTAIILALGLLLDDAVVVMENIERHYSELKKPITQAVFEGTKEIMFADLSGTITTMAALFPIMFVGDYPQTIFRPLVGTLLIALAASYIISITTVPLLSLKFLAIKHPLILKAEALFKRVSDAFNDGARNFFAQIARKGMESKKVAALYFAILFGLFAISAKGVMPIVGQELMPPMDTGIVKIEIKLASNLPIDTAKEVAQKVNTLLQKPAKLERVSMSIGSEAGVLSIGSGGGIDTIAATVTYVNRFERKKSIWDIERYIRSELAKIPHIASFSVYDYGATALSSIRANLDVMLSADSFTTLWQAAQQVMAAVTHTQGIVNVSTSWLLDKTTYELKIDEEKAAHYGLSVMEIKNQISAQLKGAVAATKSVQNSNDIFVRIWKKEKSFLQDFMLKTQKGLIPLSSIATLHPVIEPSKITREGLEYTIDVLGYREKAAISHIMANFEEQMQKHPLPPSVSLTQTGDIAQFEDSARRMVKAIIFAVILIFFVLVPMFNSFKTPFLIILSIPLTLIGAAWILLLLDYHTSMPAMMGFILLSGIIVNNAILLIEFALIGLKKGLSAQEAILQSIHVRTRPVLMTAFATTAGMLPVALGWAIGLERLAPLGAVAIGGLMVGTFLTLVFIPILFSLLYRKA